MFRRGRPLTGSGVVAKKGAAVVLNENAFPCLLACVGPGVVVCCAVVVLGVVVTVVALSGDSVKAVEKSLNVNLDTRGEGVGEKAGAGVGVCEGNWIGS